MVCEFTGIVVAYFSGQGDIEPQHGLPCCQHLCSTAHCTACMCSHSCICDGVQVKAQLLDSAESQAKECQSQAAVGIFIG